MTDFLNEQRKHLRLNIKRKARCRFLGANDTKFRLMSMMNVNVNLVNLSAGGACISCEESFGACAVRKNGIVKLEIPFPGETVNMTGRIVWCEPAGKGVRAGIIFQNTGEEDSKKLINYLSNELRFIKNYG